MEYTFSRTEGKPSVGEQVIVDLVRKRGEAKKDFCDHMRIRTDYPTQSLKVWVGRDIKDTQDPVLDVWLGYTPLDAEQRTNRTFGYLSVKKPPIPGLIHVVWPFVTWFTEKIFREDKEIVEYEQTRLRRAGRGLEQRGVSRAARSARRARALRQPDPRLMRVSGAIACERRHCV